MELATLDYHYLTREWQALVGGRIQKIYLKDRLHALHIYANGQQNTFIASDSGAFLTSAKLAYPTTPPGYCTFLRKRIGGGRITSIKQRDLDRIIIFTIDTIDGQYELVIELLGKINSMLLKDGKIVSIFETHSYTDRTIRGGVDYTPPPSKPTAWQADKKTLIGKQAGKAFAIELGLGGKYSDELCARTGIERNEKVQDKDVEGIALALDELREHAITARTVRGLSLPFKFLSVTEADPEHSVNEYPTFNAAVDAILSEQLEKQAAHEASADTRKVTTKREKILSAQQQQLLGLEAQATEHQQLGELIYEHYAELQPLLDAIKADWKTLEHTVVREKYANHPLVKAIHDDGSIVVELENNE